MEAEMLSFQYSVCFFKQILFSCIVFKGLIDAPIIHHVPVGEQLPAMGAQ